MPMNDTDKRAMIERRVATEGLTVKDWREDPDDGLIAGLGRYVVVTDEYEDDGLYSGDEGELTASVVGAPEYGNVRVYFGFTPDDIEGSSDVRDFSALDPVDA